MIYSIYKVKNNVNGKIYIGFTQDFERRKSAHISLSNRGSTTKFHRALRKYGEEAFEWEIVFQGKDEYHILNWAEPFFIKEYDAFSKNGYNMTSGGENGATQSDETKRKRSESLTGEKHPLFGKNHSQKSKEKMSVSHGGDRNANAKTFKFISPTGEIFIIKGQFKKFCEENSLSRKVMVSNLNKGVISETNYSHRTKLSSNCIGWSVMKI